jgi:predicted dehydrogenase
MDGEDPFLGLGWPGEFGRVAVVPRYPHRDPERELLLEGVRVDTFGIEAREVENIKDYARQFAACVAEGRQPPITLEDGLKSLEIALAARTSSLEDGDRISLPLSASAHAKATDGFMVQGTVDRERNFRANRA